MNRDSLVLWLGLAVAIVGYLITAAKPPFEWSYMEWLQAASFALAWGMGKLGSSPLPGKHDDQNVSGRGGLLGVFVALAIGGSMLAGCVGGKTVALPANVPLAIESTDGQLRAAADRAVKMLSASQDLLVEVIKAEKVIEPSMSEGVKAQTRSVLHRVNAGIITAAQAIKTAARTAKDINTAVDTALAEVQKLTDLAAAFRQPGGFGELAAKLFDYVKSIVGGAGVPVLEGARS